MSNITDHTAYRTRHSDTLPATCNPGDLYTDDTGGATGLYVCVVANTWIGPFSTTVGTVTSVSVTTANGLSGTVANSTTTPALTLNISALDAAKIADGSVSSTEFQRLDGVTSGIQTQFSGKVSGPASATDNHLAVFDGTTGKLIKDGGAIPSSITNSAGASVVPKSDGTNLVASQIIDDGTNIQVGGPASSTTINSGGGNAASADFITANPSILLTGEANSAQVFIDGSTHNLGVVTVTGSDTVNLVSKTESVVISGTAHTITNTAATSISNVTPLWGAGSDGTRFQIDGAGRIVKYNNSGPADGEILVGNSGDKFEKVTLTPSTGISIANGAGSITIAQDPLASGAPLSCLVSNTALSAATGTVYSSPGYGGTPLAAATEAAVGWAVPRAGTINALQVYSGTTAKVNTPSTVVTVRKNGVDTTLTLTLTQTVSTLSTDNTHSFTVARGDIITVSFTTTGAAAVSTSIAGVSFLLN